MDPTFHLFDPLFSRVRRPVCIEGVSATFFGFHQVLEVVEECVDESETYVWMRECHFNPTYAVVAVGEGAVNTCNLMTLTL